MPTINIHAAKTHFSRLVDQAAAGEEIVIAKDGKPMAKLVALAGADDRPQRTLGLLQGKLFSAPNFDAPLPDDVLDAFEDR
jgi:prevent-host-death family protein